MTTATAAPATLSPELRTEVGALLHAHIQETMVGVLQDLRRYLPAIRAYLAQEQSIRDQDWPGWLYAAAYQATMPDGSECVPAFRSAAIARTLSLLAGCPVHTADCSRPLVQALEAGGLIYSYYDVPADPDGPWSDSASVTGYGLAKAVGIDLYLQAVGIWEGWLPHTATNLDAVFLVRVINPKALVVKPEGAE